MNNEEKKAAFTMKILRDDDMKGLSEKVNESISDGWKVAGTMAVVVKDSPTAADGDYKNR